MGDGHEVCNTRLGLGIGLDDFVPKRDHQQKNKRVICLDLSFPLHFKDEDMDIGCKTEGSSSKTTGEEERQSTISNSKDDDQNNNGVVRKKLRLTKEQSTVLEHRFKQHTTLNTAQKQALAEKLNLKPRQIEVWFQNRRARTKLKQTEVDCEFLKKCCENLSDENRRLKKELQELRSLKMEKAPQPFYVQLQKAATIAMCPSCEEIARSAKGCGGDIVKHERTAAAAAAGDVVHKPKHKQQQSGLNCRS